MNLLTECFLAKHGNCLKAIPFLLEPFIHPKIEPEIAFLFNKELKGPSVSVTQVLDATAYIAPAIEIIDSRYRNFNFTLPDVIADNSSSSRYIIRGANFIE